MPSGVGRGARLGSASSEGRGPGLGGALSMSGTLVSLLSEMLDVRMPRNNSLHKVRDASGGRDDPRRDALHSP